MKIAFVTDVVYPYVKGGAEKRIYEISKRLAGSGHEVHVYSIKWWDGPDEMIADGIRYHGVCKPRDLYVEGKRSIAEAVLFGLWLTIPLLKERFDVIDCNQHPYFSIFTCKLAASLKKSRFLVTWHEVWGDYWYEYIGRPGFFGKAIENITAKLPDGVIAVSDRTCRALQGIGVSDNKLTIVPNGISCSAIQSMPPTAGKWDVAFAGRLIKDKHVDMLLKACAQIDRRMKIMIIGEGPEKESLMALASELKLESAMFTGALDEESLISRLKSSRLFVLPSTREGFSITTLEMLACGVPVITVRHERNYASDLIEDGGTGIIAEPNEKSLGESISRLLDNEELRELMSGRCIKSVAGYDWDILVEKLTKYYMSEKDPGFSNINI